VSALAGISGPSGDAGRPKALATFEPPRYDIAPQVHVCVTGDGSVLLDLKRDKYLGLGRRETEWLAVAVDAWPKPVWDAVGPAGECNNEGRRAGNEERIERGERIEEAAVRDLCRSLVEAGILVCATDGCAPQRREPVFNMRREWISIGDEVEVNSRVTPAHTMNFVRAYVLARFSLTLRPFATVVEAARARKSRCRVKIERDVLQIAGLVGVFRQLRPFVFAPEGRCLLHAVALINFLAHYDFYPDWVIGVATQPWGAHSWVQWGDYLLDSNPEKICRFAPILVV
jgi:hypothetical protein